MSIRHLNPLLAAICIGLGGWAQEKPVDVSVQDADGQALADVVVYALPLDKATGEPIPKQATNTASLEAIMDQKNKQFSPLILAVQRGTLVHFPNNDDVSHHVYSFSPAKQFQLRLYKGETHQPQRFGSVGEVVLGCNIHDWMVGYIYVVDTPHFSQTDAKGQARLHLPKGKYRLFIWHPRIKMGRETVEQTFSVDETAPQAVSFTLKHHLKPSPFSKDRDRGRGY